MSIDLDSLPQRIQCPQDVEDVYEAFANWANGWVAMRTPYERRSDLKPRIFVDPLGRRYVTQDDLCRLSELLREDMSHSFAMRVALSEIGGQMCDCGDARSDHRPSGCHPIAGPSCDCTEFRPPAPRGRVR